MQKIVTLVLSIRLGPFPIPFTHGHCRTVNTGEDPNQLGVLPSHHYHVPRELELTVSGLVHFRYLLAL